MSRASPMPTLVLPRLTLILPVVAALFCPSCDLYSCKAGETERDDACEQLQQAAERKGASCDVSKDALGLLCQLNCVKSSLDGQYCRSTNDLAACQQAIDGLACRNYSRVSIEAIDACSTLLDRLATDCVDANASSSSHHDHDWD
jgi:hypothetical protein